MVWYTLEQRVFLYDTYLKYGSAIKYRRKFWRKFHDERVPSRQTIHSLVNKRRPTELSIDNTQKHKHRVLTEKSDDIGARLEHTPRKSLKRLAQETGVSKSSTRRASQLLKLRPYKTTVIHALQPRDPARHGSSLQLVSTVCRRRRDRSAIDIILWWSVVSLAGIHKYAK
jgi:hypothetical protein